jgi:hypothetical protein
MPDSSATRWIEDAEARGVRGGDARARQCQGEPFSAPRQNYCPGALVVAPRIGRTAPTTGSGAPSDQTMGDRPRVDSDPPIEGHLDG